MCKPSLQLLLMGVAMSMSFGQAKSSMYACALDGGKPQRFSALLRDFRSVFMLFIYAPVSHFHQHHLPKQLLVAVFVATSLFTLLRHVHRPSKEAPRHYKKFSKLMIPDSTLHYSLSYFITVIIFTCVPSVFFYKSAFTLKMSNSRGAASLMA